MGLTFHVGAITTSGDKLGSQHRALLAASVWCSACYESLTANLTGGVEDPGALPVQESPTTWSSWEHEDLPSALSLISWSPGTLSQYPAPTPTMGGKQSPAQPCKACRGGERGSGDASGIGCRSVCLNSTLWDHSSSWRRGSHFTGKPFSRRVCRQTCQ